MTAPSRPDQPHKIQPPRGTRDLYPVEAARRRWLTERWREVSVRHGFEEAHGPTFEASDLYAVKSGDGILGELFQAFSGKSPDEVEQVKDTGRAPYALRPEFTPTLARMYAARAAGLPKPCKWFMAGPFFRAERPQRGRLREFLQWNCDVLGLDIPAEKWNAEDAECRAEVAEAKARMDAECIASLVDFLESVGLDNNAVRVKFNTRDTARVLLDTLGVSVNDMDRGMQLLDAATKIKQDEFETRATQLGIAANHAKRLPQALRLQSLTPMEFFESVGMKAPLGRLDHSMGGLVEQCEHCGVSNWLSFDMSIVRGLAYYTGTVFEVIADGERAVAGGGRYDNLIELFGGPKTPAVGFAMGDVVLSLLLQDKGLMPGDDELMGLVGQQPDVFVLASDRSEEAQALIRPTVAMLRRAEAKEDGALSPTLSRGARERGLHVRHSYRATRNVGKLLKEAAQQGARFAVIIEDAEVCSVKDIRKNAQWDGTVPLADLRARLVAAM